LLFDRFRIEVASNLIVVGLSLRTQGAIFSGGTVAHAEADGVPLDDLVATLSKAHMIPRMGQPREVADAVLFLASDESSFITAHPLMVDGGWAGKP
jgi:NAD(P)-dependent dehydrogenase (short-subunit alcohol dehydrogenase family)